MEKQGAQDYNSQSIISRACPPSAPLPSTCFQTDWKSWFTQNKVAPFFWPQSYSHKLCGWVAFTLHSKADGSGRFPSHQAAQTPGLRHPPHLFFFSFLRYSLPFQDFSLGMLLAGQYSLTPVPSPLPAVSVQGSLDPQENWCRTTAETGRELQGG